MDNDISGSFGFIILVLINMINFNTHQPNVVPSLFDYNVNIAFCNISILNGSLRCYNIHLHHWLLSFFLLIFLMLFKRTTFIAFLQGAATASLIDGLLFSDRFDF